MDKITDKKTLLKKCLYINVLLVFTIVVVYVLAFNNFASYFNWDESGWVIRSQEFARAIAQFPKRSFDSPITYFSKVIYPAGLVTRIVSGFVLFFASLFNPLFL